MEAIDVIKVVANYGIGVVCLAVLIFLHLYNVRVTMPTLIHANDERLLQIVNMFSAELKNTREVFACELREEREQCHDDHEKLMAKHLDTHDLIIRVSERIRSWDTPPETRRVHP